MMKNYNFKHIFTKEKVKFSYAQGEFREFWQFLETSRISAFSEHVCSQFGGPWPLKLIPKVKKRKWTPIFHLKTESENLICASYHG